MPRTSSIKRLPPDILERLQSLLRDSRVTRLDAAHRINAILEKDGHPERVSPGAVYRYAGSMAAAGEKLRHSRQVAQTWITQLGTDPQGQVGRLVIELLRTLAFELALRVQDGDLTADATPGVIQQVKRLALSVERLERTCADVDRREALIRSEARQAAAERVTGLAATGQLSDQQAAAIRAAILSPNRLQNAL